VKLQSYKLKFTPENLETTGLTATLVDKFLNTNTPVSLSDSTTVSFTITTNAASYAADRFYVVFKGQVVLPVTITRLSATATSDKNIAVTWNTENETSLKQYELERSSDGHEFSKINTDLPKANNGGAAMYNYLDMHPLAGDNFYRVKAISLGGRVQYSSIIRVAMEKTGAVVMIYPNPVVDKKINIQFSNQEKGTYVAQLINSAGQAIYNGKLKIENSNTVQSIQLNESTAAGNYQLKITAEDGTTIVKAVMIR
jgi:hypothetical protein